MSDAPDSNVLERLRAAVESSPSGLLMIDADGSIVLVNREVERLFGYAREELLGRSVELLVPVAHRGAHPDFRARFLLSPRVRAMGAGRELHGVRKDGTEVPVEIGLFYDTGVAWDSRTKPSVFGGEKDLVSSYGATARLNLMGFVVLQFDLAKPVDRPDKGTMFQFNILSAF